MLLNKSAEVVIVLIAIRVCQVDCQQGHQLFLTEVLYFAAASSVSLLFHHAFCRLSNYTHQHVHIYRVSQEERT